MFLPNIYIESCADDSTPYAMNKSSNELVRDIKMASEWFFTWFHNNIMKAKLEKFHLLRTGTDCLGIEVCSQKIENSFCEKLLDIKVNTKLKFEEHVETMCKKPSKKINSLARI